MSQVQAFGGPLPVTWLDYERGCLLTFGGGYQDDRLRSAFHHGINTVFNLLRREFPPAEQCKAAPDLLAACKAAIEALEQAHREEQQRADGIRDDYNRRHLDDINTPPEVCGGVEVPELPILEVLRKVIAKATEATHA